MADIPGLASASALASSVVVCLGRFIPVCCAAGRSPPRMGVPGPSPIGRYATVRDLAVQSLHATISFLLSWLGVLADVDDRANCAGQVA